MRPVVGRVEQLEVVAGNPETVVEEERDTLVNLEALTSISVDERHA